MKEYIDSKKDEIIQEVKNVIAFKSVSVETGDPEIPFGEDCKKVLEYV